MDDQIYSKPVIEKFIQENLFFKDPKMQKYTETRKAYHDDREHGDDNLKIDGVSLLKIKEKV